VSDDFDEMPHEESHEEPWLVSYADLMTLLFGFFVLMYTFAMAKLENEDQNMENVRKELSQYFGGEYATPYQKLAEDFKRSLKGSELGKSIVITTTPEGMTITMRSTTLFTSGSAGLYPQAKTIIESLATLLIDKSQKLKVVVEGHTDDEPLRSSSIFPSNWELSGARASSVVRIFEKAGFLRTLLQSIGYSDTRPELPNRNADGTAIPENMARNRRVTIKISDDSPLPAKIIKKGEREKQGPEALEKQVPKPLKQDL
jgi:chemotaxis protein MotB